jgi:cell fate (sporulation/competence/biofilm development) regulator YlbF (YheA/YmcA/DUF963 family)
METEHDMSENQDELADEIRRQLEEWNLGLDEFQDLIERTEASQQAPDSERIRELRTEYTRASERFETLAESGTDTWDEFHTEVTEARRLLDKALNEVRGGPDD